MDMFTLNAANKNAERLVAGLASGVKSHEVDNENGSIKFNFNDGSSTTLQVQTPQAKVEKAVNAYLGEDVEIITNISKADIFTQGVPNWDTGVIDIENMNWIVSKDYLPLETMSVSSVDRDSFMVNVYAYSASGTYIKCVYNSDKIETPFVPEKNILYLVAIKNKITGTSKTEDYVGCNIFIKTKHSKEIALKNSPLYEKKMLLFGDSIVRRLGNGSGNYIQRYTRCTVINKAVGGYTFRSPNTNTDVNSDDKLGLIYNEIVPMANESADYILIGGGVNDAIQTLSLGNITSGLNDELDESTVYGGLEKCIRYIINNPTWIDSKICGFITYKMVRNTKEYMQALRDVFEKYGIPYIDLYKNCKLDSNNEYYKDKYFVDTCHINDNGYGFVIGQIIKFLESI